MDSSPRWYLIISAMSEYLFTQHQSVAHNLSNKWRSTFEIGAVQIRDVTEIAPKSPLFCVYRNTIRYGFRAGARVSITVWTQP